MEREEKKGEIKIGKRREENKGREEKDERGEE